MNQVVTRIASWIVALMVPLFLIILTIRLVFTPLSVQIVYRTPGFPPDPYGFSMADRMQWSRISLEYLFNNSDISFLANQHLSDGQPLYNERELNHMADVKVFFQSLTRTGIILFIALAAFGLWAWRGQWLPAFLHGLGNGGKLTIAFVFLIMMALVTSFDALFTFFHRLFFSGNSWLFLYSDTLIRLFPLPLWEMAFITVGILTLLGAIFLIWLEKRAIR